MKKLRTILVLLLLLGTGLAPTPAQAQIPPESPHWYEQDAAGNVQIHFYFFWSKSCPHCLAAHPLVSALPTQYPWLILHEYELTEHPENADRYMQMAAALGEEAQYVPAFFTCGVMLSGYDNDLGMGRLLQDKLVTCYEQVQAYVATQPPVAAADTAAESAAPVATTAAEAPVAAVIAPQPAANPSTIRLPWIGAVDVQTLSLPTMTLVLAGMDAFNPCAFFVLMFLLSLLVHAQSRKRMLLIGSIFVLCSGLVYFLFMAAWLNLFLVMGAQRWITLAAGLVAIAIATINIKDYFWFKQGVSLTIPERAKPKLYQRTRNLVRANSLPTLLLGTTMLAIAANSYELLCTAGFPMIYTRMLTLHALSTPVYYAYLAAYNVIYVIPLLLIVLFFAVKFGSRKLGEAEGRMLKLVSGVMMLLLGILLVATPDLLGQVTIAIALLLFALLITALLVIWERHAGRGRSHPPLSGKTKQRHA
ncbi:MAG: hypothetical protein R3E79_45940 [Caldilineaceae bacterium]